MSNGRWIEFRVVNEILYDNERRNQVIENIINNEIGSFDLGDQSVPSDFLLSKIEFGDKEALLTFKTNSGIEWKTIDLEISTDFLLEND